MEPSEKSVGTSGGLGLIVAEREHIAVVQRLLSAASRRAARLGCRMWWVPFPVAVIEESVRRGETYLFVRGQAVVGTLALSWDDPLFWGRRPPDAGYVHRLCIDPATARRGLGVELLSWADITVAERGRDFVRLDSPASNSRLRLYYEALDFRCQGEVDVVVNGGDGAPELWRAALYERVLRKGSQTP